MCDCANSETSYIDPADLHHATVLSQKLMLRRQTFSLGHVIMQSSLLSCFHACQLFHDVVKSGGLFIPKGMRLL